MHILISPNAFKHSLNAAESAEAIREGLKQSMLMCSAECFPIGDGGDGTGNLIIEKFKGTRYQYDVHDPLNRIIKAPVGLINNDKTAIIEMADASGLRLLHAGELAPLRTSSFGTGELIRHALDHKVDEIIIGLGGSATVDGGIGILSALGVRFLDIREDELSALPQNLPNVEDIDISGIDQRIYNCNFTVLCDVDNPLLGKQGAATVFGPQKGAASADIPKLESALNRLSKIAFKKTGKTMAEVKYGGAAGGSAAALFAFCNADLVNGAEYFLQLTDFRTSLSKADLLITGEGSLDEQTLQGKAPFAAAKLAKEQNIAVIGIAGKVPLKKNPTLDRYFDVLMAIGHHPTDLDTAIKFTSLNLTRTSAAIGNLLAISKK